MKSHFTLEDIYDSFKASSLFLQLFLQMLASWFCVVDFSLLVILVCKVIISGLRIAILLSVSAVSVYQSVRMDCRGEMGNTARCGGFPLLLGNSSYVDAYWCLGSSACAQWRLCLFGGGGGEWLACPVVPRVFPHHITMTAPEPASVSPWQLPHRQLGWSTHLLPAPS